MRNETSHFMCICFIADWLMTVNTNVCTIATSADLEDLRQDVVLEAVVAAKAITITRFTVLDEINIFVIGYRDINVTIEKSLNSFQRAHSLL